MYEGQSNININLVIKRCCEKLYISFTLLHFFTHQYYSYSIQYYSYSAYIRAMSEQMVPTCVMQRIIIKFLTREEVKPSEILSRLWPPFGAEALSKPKCTSFIKVFWRARNQSHNRHPQTSIKTKTSSQLGCFLMKTGVSPSMKLLLQ